MLLLEEEDARGSVIVLKIRIQVFDADKNWGNTDTTDHLSHKAWSKNSICLVIS